MGKERSKTGLSSRADTPRAVDDLAATALARVATGRVLSDPGSPNPRISRRLLDSVMQRSREPHRTVMESMLKGGISPDAIVDVYIPEVARLMGVEWEVDTANFAQVTLGSSRLQALLRDLEQVWHTGQSGIGQDMRPLIRVRTLPDAQHTLGASVLAAQLRRLNCSVRLETGPVSCDTRGSADACDAIFISAATSDRIEDVARLAAGLRDGAPATTPIVLGGSLLHGKSGLKSRTGVDHLAPDCRTALEACGIKPMWTNQPGR